MSRLIKMNSYMKLRANLHARQAAAKKRKQQRQLGLAGALTAILALSGGAHVKRTGNARAANARAANFRKSLHAVGTHHIELPGNHSVTKTVYKVNNGGYYIHTGNGTGNSAGYSRVTKTPNAYPFLPLRAHHNWYKLAK